MKYLQIFCKYRKSCIYICGGYPNFNSTTLSKIAYEKNELGKLIPANAYLLLVVPFVTMMVGPFIHGIVLDWLLNGSAIFMILFAIVATIAFAKAKAYQAIVLIWLTVLTALTPFIMILLL